MNDWHDTMRSTLATLNLLQTNLPLPFARCWQYKSPNDSGFDYIHASRMFPPKGRENVNVAAAGINALPWELVRAIVVDRTPMMMRPVLRCVHPAWAIWLKGTCIGETVCMKPVLVSKRYRYRHVCATNRRCTIHYAKLAIDRGWWNIVEWMLDCTLPFDIINDLDAYACSREVSMGEGDLSRIELWSQRGVSWTHCKAWTRAAQYAIMHVIDWFMERRAKSTAAREWTGNSALVCAAAKGGHIDIVRLLLYKAADLEHVCLLAAKHGHLELLEWLHGRRLLSPSFVCTEAALKGHLAVIQWACSHGCEWDSWTFNAAASGGHLHILQWLKDQCCPPPSVDDIHVSGHGHADIIRWMVENGRDAQLGVSTISQAARGGHWDVVWWLHDIGSPWDGKTCSEIARHGDVEMLRWARSRGCPWDEGTCIAAASAGHLEVLQWARSNGCPWNGEVCARAAAGGHLKVLQWARSNGCPWSSKVCACAAARGHLEVLQWARSEGCMWDYRTCFGAMQGGHLDTLKWAMLHKCPSRGLTCDHAAERGDLEMVKWLCQSGCPWNVRTCKRAAYGGHLHVLQWMLARGCPYSDRVSTAAADGCHPDILHWLQAQKYSLHPNALLWLRARCTIESASP